jgi:hypothetical protein
MSIFRGELTTTNWEDFILQPKPANPPNTLIRLYADSTLGQLTAINSLGNTVIGGAGSSTGAFGAAINVKASPYNAVGDVQQIQDGVSSGTSLTSATANFKSTDVGKIIFCNASGSVVVTQTTIKAVVSSTQVTLTSGSGSGSSLVCAWGTQDDTPAFVAATTAALTTSGNNISGGPFLSPYAKTIYIPPGGYFVSSVPFNLLVGGGNTQGVSIIGDSAGTSTIYPMQTFSQGSLGGNQGFIVNAYGSGNTFKNFAINGSALTYTNTNNTSVFNASCGNCLIDHITIYSFGLAAQAGYISVGGQQIRVTNSLFQQAPTTVGNAIACQINGAAGALFLGNICSNVNTTLSISGEAGASTGSQVTLVGSIFDECSGSAFTGCSNVGTSKDVVFVGCTIWANGTVGSYALSVDGTSIVRLDSCFVGPYNTNVNVGGVNIASGGQVLATNSQFGFNGTGVAVHGAAGSLFQDVGGNKIVSCNSIPCTPAATSVYSTNAFTGGIIPTASLTHTPNTVYAVQGNLLTTAQTLVSYALDQNYQLVSIAVGQGGTTPPTTTCATAPVVTITDGTNSATLTLTTGNTSWSSTGLSTVFTKGNTFSVSIGANTCATPPQDIYVNYILQSVMNS